MSTCLTCAEPLDPGARFCPHCGTAVSEGDTRRLELPPNETGAVPVQYGVAEPRYFGIAPATLLFAVAVVAAVVAVVLFATAHWPLALICVGAALLALAGFLEVARRKPDAPVARATGEALWTLRQRAEAAVEAMSARTQAARRVTALRRELAVLESVRSEQLRALGEAAYRGDEDGVATLRAAVAELEGRAALLVAELERVVAGAEARIRQARLQVQPTEMIELPEPYPPPDEGTPPTPPPVPEPSPTPVPEPYPPPDEATPPAPAIIPEPGPDDTQ